jgi:outer membrane protein TolC
LDEKENGLKPKYILILSPIFLFGDGLREYIELASKNENIKSLEYTKKSKDIYSDSIIDGYFPRVDGSGSILNTTNKNPTEPTQIYQASIKGSYTIFDGYKKDNLISEAKNLAISSNYDIEYNKKLLSLNVAQYYYNILSIRQDILAKNLKKDKLDENLKRVSRFFEAGLTSRDNVEKIQATIELNNYEIDNLMLQFEENKLNIELISGKKFSDNPSFDKFIEPINIEEKTNDFIKSMEYQSKSIKDKASTLSSVDYPTVKIEDTLSFQKYIDSPSDPKNIQNKILLVANMVIFDKDSTKKQKESIILQKFSLDEKLNFETKRVKMSQDLSIIALKNSNQRILSSKKSLDAMDSTFELVEKRYKANLTDTLHYLDALTNRYEALANYQKSLINYELTKAKYYFAYGYNILEYIQK